MKKELLVLSMVIGMTAALTASGQQEEDTQFNGWGPGRGQGKQDGMRREFSMDEKAIEEMRAQRQAEFEEWLADQDVVSVTGSLTLVNGELPYVETDGIKYSFMAPWRNLGDLELTDGMEVSVEGYEMPGPRLQWDESEKHVMVTKAVINGDEVEIEHPADGSGFRGGFGGGDGRGGRGGKNGGMMGRRS